MSRSDPSMDRDIGLGPFLYISVYQLTLLCVHKDEGNFLYPGNGHYR